MIHADSLNDSNLIVVVFGASGDLATKKVYPALWNLYKQGQIQNAHIVGYARSPISTSVIMKRLEGAVGENERKNFERFGEKNHYIRGFYDQEDSFINLKKCLDKIGANSNRLYYMALPPDIYITVSSLISQFCMETKGWVRIVFEKPFGRDSSSSQTLSTHLRSLFEESTLYRMDHYLGKEIVRNITTFRFANLVFSPIWNRDNIKEVAITFKENFGVQGRAGYFDNYGIIRDVVQNHLLQIFSLLAMEMPHSWDDIREQKVKLLRCVREAESRSTVVGQYEGYLEEDGVPSGSRAPTMAATVLYVDNERWQGVPFFIRAGKHLDERKCEVRIVFKPSEFVSQQNELVMVVGPSQAIYMSMMVMDPEREDKCLNTRMEVDLGGFSGPDPYGILIQQAIEGNQSNFVRTDELEEAWRIFTPLLESLEREEIRPVVYKKGSGGSAFNGK